MYIVTDRDRAALKKAIFDDVKNTRGVSRRAPGLFMVTDTMRKALRAEIKQIMKEDEKCLSAPPST